DLGIYLWWRVTLENPPRRYLADIHVLVLDKGFACLDPFGGPEDDRDGRSLAQYALDRDPDGYHRGENRNDPDDRDPLAPPRHDGGSGKVVGALSHGARPAY